MLQISVKRLVLTAAAAMILAMPLTASAADEAEHKLDPSLLNLKFGIVGFMDYSVGQAPLPGGDEENFNRFSVTRGYLNFHATINSWMSARVTPDIMQESGGDYKLRMKYLYAEFKLPDFGPLTSNKIATGMIQTSWCDFEERINGYRAQGAMPIDRAGIVSSADLGISIMGNIGPKIDDLKKLTGNDSFAGKYGSWHLGVYNGGGYNAVENNQNKVVQGRLSLRPLGTMLPGLQLSYFGLVGEGNAEYKDSGEYPDYIAHLGMVSFEHPRFAVTGQYFISEGNLKGAWFDSNGDAFVTEGYSFFGRVNLPVLNNKPAVFARYDYFDGDVDSKVADDADYTTWIAGLSYDLYKGNMIILAWEQTDYGDGSAGKGKLPKSGTELGDDQKFQVILQVKY